MTTTEVYSKFADIVSESLRTEPFKVTMDANLGELGAQSLDLVEISMDVESKFNIWLPEKSIIETAIQVLGRDAMLDAGLLTDFGKRILKERLPRDEWHILEGDISVKDLDGYFLTVSTWVRMIEELRRYTPEVCRKCGGAELAESPGFVLTCATCGQENSLRSGQELNREWIESFREQNGPPAAESLSSDAS